MVILGKMLGRYDWPRKYEKIVEQSFCSDMQRTVAHTGSLPAAGWLDP